MKVNKFFFTAVALVSTGVIAEGYNYELCQNTSYYNPDSRYFGSTGGGDVWTWQENIGFDGENQYVLINNNYSLKATDPDDFFCKFKNGLDLSDIGKCLADIFNGGPDAEYRFFKSYYDYGIRGRTLSPTWTSDHKINISDSERGRQEYAVFMIIDGETPSRYCDTTIANFQTPPQISLLSFKKGSGFVASKIEVSASVDTEFSKFKKPQIIYKFTNLSWPETSTTYKTYNKTIDWLPQYTGNYEITATVFDGTYKKTTRIGDIGIFIVPGNNCYNGVCKPYEIPGEF